MSEKKNITDDHHHPHDHAHSHLPSDPELRVKAVETLLLNKGLIDSKTLDELIDTYENRIGPKNGAKVVAKAWVDPCLLYTSPSPRDVEESRMPSSA